MHAPPADRCELLELLGDLRHAAGDRRAPRTFAAAADAAPADRLADLRIKQARALTAAGDPTAGLEILRDLTPAPGAQEARLAVACGIVAWYAGDLDQARREAEHAAALIHEAESERGELADLRALIAHAAGAWEQHTEWQLAEVWHVPELAGRVFDVYTCVTEYVLHAGEPYPRLAEFARRLREHAHAGGALRGEAFSTTLLGEIELLRGDLQAARTHLLEAATLSREAGAIGGEALAHASALAGHLLFIVQAQLMRFPDDPAEALALVDGAEALLDETPRCLFCSMDYSLAAATACARAGDSTRAHAFLCSAGGDRRTLERSAVGSGGGRGSRRRAQRRRRHGGGDPGTPEGHRRLRHAGQLLNEDRARRSLNEQVANAGPAR